MTLVGTEVTARWRIAFGDCPPVGYELRRCFPDRWVRFHSLPGSQRYADTESEYAEILRRQRRTLGELLADDEASGEPATVVVISQTWSNSSEPLPRSTELTSVHPASYWTSVMLDDSLPEYTSWAHLWLSRLSTDDPAVDVLLRMIADDAASAVILSDSFTWLYAPYDGGADVIARSPEERDAIKSRHAAWLPDHPSGL